MCGIIGFYGNNTNYQLTNDKRRFMLEGLYVTALRGQESTGIAVLPKDKGDTPEIYKRALSGADFIEKKSTLRLLSNISSSNGVLGHNRAATKGAIMDENSHPFQYKHITLIHNGTVQNAEWLTSKKCQADCDVDSAKVAWSFAEAEPDDLLDKMLGAYSLVWWDARDATLHFARNTERPMYWVVAEKGDTMYFGSELGMLRMLVDRNNIKIKKEAFYTSPYKHYVFKNPDKVEDYTTRPFQDPARKSKKRGNQWPAIVNQQSSNHTTNSNQHGKQQQSSSDSKSTSSQTPKSTSTSGTDSKDSTTDKEGKSYLYTTNGRPHPAQLEVLTRATVDAVTASITSKARERDTKSMCERLGLDAFKTIIARPAYWNTYQEESRFGALFLRLDTVNIQVFNVNLGLWVKCGTMGSVPVKIKGYRLSFDGSDGNPPIFVGEIDFDLFKRMYEDFERRQKIKGKPIEGETLIEIGLTRPRFVTQKEFDELVEAGCWNCEGILTEQDAETIHWFGQEETWPLCGSCGNQPQVVAEWTKMSQDNTDSLKNAVH